MQGAPVTPATAPAGTPIPSPPPPPPPQQGAAATTTPAATGGPVTAADVAGIRARRSEISNQIENVTSRRNAIAAQLRAATPGADRAGLESRLAQLDKRIVDLEKQLDATGMQLADARALAATATVPATQTGKGTMDSDQITAVTIIFTLAVLTPLAIAWARAITRRARHATERPSPELNARLERMEQGIDAIAVEVERISEGQRFVSKLLGEGPAKPVAVGQARQPGQHSAVQVPPPGGGSRTA